MRFYLFERPADAHIRKSREYLEEANLGRVEHQAAAEHHNALARMYAERITRIEAEISEAFASLSSGSKPVEEGAAAAAAAAVVAVPTVVSGRDAPLKSDPVVIYPSRASHA
ncbi:MAG: hypothetical protein M3R45_13490 [Pseudomonadota bacterium]|nr:hypothetical protein [Pseudomonadota bacterium]